MFARFKAKFSQPVKPIPASIPRRILVINYGGIGDILLATPITRSLRRAYPNATIDVYVQKNRDGILEGNQDIDNVYCGDKRRGFRSYGSFIRRFFRKYDLAVSVRCSDRQTVFAWLAGRQSVALVPEFIRKYAWHRLLLSGWVEIRPDAHMIRETLQLNEALGINTDADASAPVPALSNGRMDELLPFDFRSTPFALLHLTPRNPYKRWHIEGWQMTIGALLEQGLRVVVLSGDLPGEVDYVQGILADSADEVVCLAGATSLAEGAELMRNAELYVGVDTAVTHLAAAVGVPTIALYGGSDIRRYSPYSNGMVSDDGEWVSDDELRYGSVRLVRGACNCRSGQFACLRDLSRLAPCMQGIPANRVVKLLETAPETAT